MHIPPPGVNGVGQRAQERDYWHIRPLGVGGTGQSAGQRDYRYSPPLGVDEVGPRALRLDYLQAPPLGVSGVGQRVRECEYLQGPPPGDDGEGFEDLLGDGFAKSPDLTWTVETEVDVYKDKDLSNIVCPDIPLDSAGMLAFPWMCMSAKS